MTEQQAKPITIGIEWKTSPDLDENGRYQGYVNIIGQIGPGAFPVEESRKLSAKIEEAEKSAELATSVANWLLDHGVVDEKKIAELVQDAVAKRNEQELGSLLGSLLGMSSPFRR